MKKEIIMKPGFIVSSYVPNADDEFVACFNLESLDDVCSIGGKTEDNILTLNSCIGAWKPKGSPSVIPKQQ